MKNIIQQIDTKTSVDANAIETILLSGDLSKLSPEQRLAYYKNVCESLGLNPLTRPLDYIVLGGRLTLYAKKDAADQLRRIYNVSISKPEIVFQEDLIIVTVSGHTPDGREDAEIGVVSRKDMQGNLANVLMKAVTKAKRRLTLSICGLGFLDETEVETIPDASIVNVDGSGEIVGIEPQKQAAGNVAKESQKQNRPYDPNSLIGNLERVASKYGDIVPSGNELSYVAACMNTYLGEDGRKKLIASVFKVDSMKNLAGGMILALNRWLKPQYDTDEKKFFSADEYAPVELLNLYDAFVGYDDQEEAVAEEV